MLIESDPVARLIDSTELSRYASAGVPGWLSVGVVPSKGEKAGGVTWVWPHRAAPPRNSHKTRAAAPRQAPAGNLREESAT